MARSSNTKGFTTNKTKALLNFFYFFCILSVGLYAFKKPYYNWDVLPYMGVVLSYDNDNPKFIHDTVYEIAKKQIPSTIYYQLIDSSNNYRKKIKENAVDFYNEFPFYVVKPLYTGTIYLFYKSGFSLLKATIIPSIIAYILIGILLFIWLKTYLPSSFAIAPGLLIMLSAPLLNILRSSSPDCLAAFLQLASLYYIIERKSLITGFIFLLSSAFARVDNIIPCFFILSLLAFTNKWKEKIPLKKYLIMVLILIGSCLLITANASKYGWSLLYYPSFAQRLNIYHDSTTGFPIKNYLILFYSHITSSFFFSDFILFMLLASLIFIDKFPFQFRRASFEQMLLLVIILTIGVHILLQPLIDDRFFIAYYLCIIMVLIKKYSGLIFGER
jgi:hypothetical protein